MIAQGRLVSTSDLLFPKFNYYLDESDPDIVILRRQDDSFVAAFSADGAIREYIIEAAKEAYRESIKGHWARRGQPVSEEHRST
jgi:hypothetical protein